MRLDMPRRSTYGHVNPFPALLPTGTHFFTLAWTFRCPLTSRHPTTPTPLVRGRDRNQSYQRHLQVAAQSQHQQQRQPWFVFPDPPYRRVDCLLPAVVRWRVRAVMALEAGGGGHGAAGAGAAPAQAAVEAGAGAWLAADDIADFDD